MPRPTTQKRQETFSHSLSRVVTKRERVVVHRRGKAVAALVPLEDLARLEELDDRLDVEDFRAPKRNASRRRQDHALDEHVKELGIRA